MRAQPRLCIEAVAQIFPVAALVGLLTALYFALPRIELWFIGFLFVGLPFYKVDELHMEPQDWSVLLIAAVELTSFMFSQYRSNSVRTAVAIGLAATAFFAVRITIRTRQQIALLCLALALGGLCIGLSTIHQFVQSASVLREAGLQNLLAFRSRLVLAPSHWVTGEWFTLLLLTLPFTCALQLFSWSRVRTWTTAFCLIVALVISAALMLSLSRSIFGSFITFCVSACALIVLGNIVTLRKSFLLLAISFLVLLVILLCESAVYPGIFSAYAGQQTSQVRSTYGRLVIWRQSIHIFLNHPIWGVGSSNAGLALTALEDPEKPIGAITNTFSFPLQILVEKGAIGFLAYAVFLTTLSHKVFVTLRLRSPVGKALGQSKVKSGNDHLPGKKTAVFLPLADLKQLIACSSAGLLALTCHELVYASVLQHPSTVMIAAILCGLACADVNT
jgi:O-antigen ligase